MKLPGVMGDSAEARFARKLASNDGKTRTRALKSLKKWMTARSAVEDGIKPYLIV